MAHAIRRYGIKKRPDGRYHVVTEVAEDKKHYCEHPTLNYAQPELALRKAREFQSMLSREFTDFRGEKWTFELVCVGIVE